MARTVTFVIAPIGDGGWGLRLDGVRERGDIGRLEVAKEPPVGATSS